MGRERRIQSADERSRNCCGMMRVQSLTDEGFPIRRISRFTAYTLFLLLFFTGSHQRVAAQQYDLRNDEFSLTLPSNPEYDKEFNRAYPSYHPYRVTVGGVHYFFLLMERNSTVRKGYEHQAWALKGHSIGYNAGFKREMAKDGISVEVERDRDLRLNGFPGMQFRIVSSAGPGVLRFYVTDRFIYTLQVRRATEQDRAAKTFFDSFKLGRPLTRAR